MYTSVESSANADADEEQDSDFIKWLSSLLDSLSSCADSVLRDFLQKKSPTSKIITPMEIIAPITL